MSSSSSFLLLLPNATATAVTVTTTTLRWLQESSNPDNDTDTTTDDDDDDETTTTTTTTNMTASIVSSMFLFLLIFGLSATVDIQHLKYELRNKFALATGVVMQFVIMPLLGFLAVLALRHRGLTPAMGITLLVVTASPGGSYSNWWCSTFNADLALSVAMTAVSTLLSIGLLPANLFIYTVLVYGVASDNADVDDQSSGGGSSIMHALDFKAIFISLAIVICAILLGLYASHCVQQHVSNSAVVVAFHKWSNRLGSLSGICLILVSLLLSSSSSSSTNDESSSNFWSAYSWTFYVGVALPCIIGLALANVASRLFRLRKPEQVAISIECCYQNVGIATSVAVTMFAHDPVQRAQAVAVPLFYGIVEAVVIGIYCIVSWKLGWTKAPRDEKLCVVVTNTYEIGHDHDDDDDENDEQLDDELEEDDDNDEQNESGTTTLVTHLAEQPLSLTLQGDSIPEEEEGLRHLVKRWRAWIAWPFVPRYPDEIATADAADTTNMRTPTTASRQRRRQHRHNQQDVELATTTTTILPNNDDSKDNNKPSGQCSDEPERSRFVSEDYTAATTTSTTDGNLSPPNTPNGIDFSFESNDENDADEDDDDDVEVEGLRIRQERQDANDNYSHDDEVIVVARMEQGQGQVQEEEEEERQSSSCRRHTSTNDLCLPTT